MNGVSHIFFRLAEPGQVENDLKEGGDLKEKDKAVILKIIKKKI